MPALLVPLVGPLDVAASLERFRRWGDDGIERWDGDRYVSTAPLAEPIAFAARPVGSLARPAFEVLVEDTPDEASAAAVRQTVGRHLRSLFVQAPDGALESIERSDPIVRVLVERYGRVRPVLQRDVFTALVRSISAQQVNLAWAATTRRRLAQRFGSEHRVDGTVVFSLPAERLAAADPSELRELQFTWAKSRSIVGCAQAVAGGGFGMAELDALSDEAVIERLVSLPGIGRWTAEWFLARTLGRPRVVAGDLGVRKAVGAAYLGRSDRDLPPEDEVRAVGARWGAAAGIVQQLLLEWLGDGRPDLGPAG